MADDQRKSYRIVLAPLQEAYLTLGDRSLPVRLLDQSAGGFGVLCPGDPKVVPGDLARLQVEDTVFEVRVASVRPHKPLLSAAVAAGESDRPQPLTAFRLGLERIRDLGPSDHPRRQAKRPDWWPWRQSGRTVSALPAAAVGVALLLATVPLAAVMSNSGSDRAQPGTTRTSETETKPPAPARTTPSPLIPAAQQPGGSPDSPQAEQTTSAGDVTSQAPSRRSARADISEGDRHRQQAAEVIAKVPGAAALLRPEVTERLALGETQGHEIRRLCEATVEAIRQIDRRWAGAEPQVRDALRRRVAQESRRRALELLSEEQLARWRALESAVAPFEPEDDRLPRLPTKRGD